MKSSEILRGAARLVEMSEQGAGSDVPKFGCHAIRAVMFGVDSSWWDERAGDISRPLYYFRVFEPSEFLAIAGWWGSYREFGPRIIGLCLAAAIAESEGD